MIDFCLQELDYVYHDVSGVMTESLMQGADMIAMKVIFRFALLFHLIFLVTISPSFYEQLFHTNVLRAAFLYLHCRLILVRPKEIGAKAAF